jgi:hypothetical protein
LIRDSSNDLKCKKRRIELVLLGPKLGYDNMQRFSRPERRINGPTISHLWCVIMLILLCLSLLLIYLIALFLTLGLCWGCLMFWCNLTILKMLRQAYLMTFHGTKGMHLVFAYVTLSSCRGSSTLLSGSVCYVFLLFLLWILLY